MIIEFAEAEKYVSPKIIDLGSAEEVIQGGGVNDPDLEFRVYTARSR